MKTKLTAVALGALTAALTVVPASPAAAVPARPVRACLTSVTEQPQGATVLRTTVRVCTGGIRCVRVERVLPNGKVRLVSDSCTVPSTQR